MLKPQNNSNKINEQNRRQKGARLRPRPEINAGNQDLADITNRVWEAIKTENDPPQYFRYGGEGLRHA